MRTRCRNGDIAIIVRELPGLEANVGRLVWVYGPPRPDSVFGFEWEVAPVTDLPMGFRSDDVISFDRIGRVITHPDRWLVTVARSSVVRRHRPGRPGATVPFNREWIERALRGGQ